jgi:hypothetical protein
VTPEEQAALDASQEKQLRDLAAQIAQMSKLGFDPMTIRKGVIAAVNDTTAPPTVSINVSGDTSTIVSQVRTLNNYTPLVGQTILLAKQGTEIFILGAIAAGSPLAVNSETDNGWKKATLEAGSHGGNGNGDVYYRRVLDHGSWKMQWRGGWNVSGTTIITGLDPDYRPTSLRSLPAARSANGAATVKVDFQTNGNVVIVGYDAVPSVNSLSVGGLSGSTSSISSHSHGISFDLGTHDHFGATTAAGGHSHSVGTDGHDHTVTVDVSAPTWVSLNGLEYFL